MKTTLRLLSVLTLACAAVSLQADDATDSIDAAKEAYQSGNYSQALTALETANQFIRQLKAEQVAKLLPSAPSGWEAAEPEIEVAPAGMLGGRGVTATRSYSRGDNNVTIKIQSDSALLQYAAVLNMADTSARLETTNGQQISVSFATGGDSGKINAVVEGRYYVEIEGNGLTRAELVSFAKAVDFPKLAALK